MPKTCCVPGCKSNYNSTLKAGGSMVSTFGFPKDGILKGKWLKAIPRDNWSPSKYSVVCSIHFPENDIIREDIFVLPDGTVKKIPTKTKLKPDAVPCIFPNLPEYLSKKVPVLRKSPEERHNENLARHNELNESFEKSDLINSFEDFILNYPKQISISDSWTIKVKKDSKIYFYILNLTEDLISIVNQISVDINMVVKVFVNNTELTFKDLNWILPFDLKLTRWSQLENLLVRYKDEINIDQSFTFLIEKSVYFLSEASEKLVTDSDILEAEDGSEGSNNLNNILPILINQVKLLILKKSAIHLKL